MISYYDTAYLCVLISAFIVSCTSQDNTTEQSGLGIVHGDTLQLTPEQQSRAHLVFAPAERQSISQDLRVYGTIHVPPEFAYSITPPLGGIVVSTRVLPGSRVVKGQTLLTMEHPDFITLQQEYLTTVTRLDAANAELQRQQLLSRDSINARKRLELAQSEVTTLRIQRKALAEKLALLNIRANSLSESNLSRTISVPSPITGFVTDVRVNNGMYVASNVSMVELADVNHMHIELSVYERDVSRVAADQLVRVRLTNDTDNERIGHVHLVGREVRQDRTVAVHAHLNQHDANLVPGTTLSAVIETTPHQGWVVPESAVVRFNGKFYVFTGNAKKLIRHEVRAGEPQRGRIEIQSEHEWISSANVLVSGATAALGAMVNTDE